MVLTAEKISKKIGGNCILDDISLKLESGKIYGFVGPNGSGKTMLFRALSGLMSIDSGAVTLDGKVLRKDFPVLPNLGIVIENVGLYPELTGFENLCYLADFNRKIGEKDICAAIERVGLNPKDKRTYRKYSLGMKQRIAIAQAIMEKPDIIMLDEPTNALDSDGVEQIRGVILEEKERGALVLIASHNREDIARLTDKCYRLDAGRLTEEVPCRD